MKNNKSKKIFIISIIVLVVVLIIGIAFAVFATDLFKSDKDLFFKYASQLFGEENAFVEPKIEEYYKKVESASNENSGTISIGQDEDELISLISFEGVKDQDNNLEEKISINFSEDVKLPMTYKKVDNKHGIKIEELSKRFYAVKSENIIKGLTELLNNNNIADQAKRASLVTALSEAKSNVAMKVSSILADCYAENGGKDSNDLGNKVIKANFLDCETSKSTIEVEEMDDDKYVGKIIISSTYNSKSQIIGKVTKNGTIEWTEKNLDKIDAIEEEEDEAEENNILEKMVLTDAEKEKLVNNYFKPLAEKIDNSAFTKVSTTDSKGYSLKITNKNLCEVIIKLLDTLKNDDEMIEKLNKSYGMNISKDSIQDFIDSYNEENVTDGTTSITVYQKDGKLNRVNIQFNDEFKCDISKLGDNNNNVTYEVEFENNDITIKADLKYAGLQNLEEVKEEHTFTVNSKEASGAIKFDNTVVFNTDTKVSDFESKNTVVLNEIDSKKAELVIKTFGENFVELIGKKLIDSGLVKDTSSLDPESILKQMQTNAMSNSLQSNETETSKSDEDKKDDEDKTSKKSNTTTNNTTTSNTTKSNSTSSSSSDLLKGIEETEKEAFNTKYTTYEGENVKGSNVKQLLTHIIANNMVEDGHKIEVTGDIVLTGNSVPKTVETSKTYKVEVSTSSTTGFVNKVKITEN